MEYEMHDRSHTVYRLAIHEPQKQSVVFRADNLDEVLLNASTKDTMLTGWFKLNREDTNANKYLYSEIPTHYTWIKSSCKWQVRKQFRVEVISRIYRVNPQIWRTLLLENVTFTR